MSILSIRPLAEHGLLPLLGLYAELHPADMPPPAPEQIYATWQAMLNDQNLICLGGFLGDQLVCTCTLSITPNLTRGARPYGLIENVVTATKHRRRGFGHALLAHAKAIAWQHDCYKVMLMTSRHDAATQAFYASAGFDAHSKQAYYAAAPT